MGDDATLPKLLWDFFLSVMCNGVWCRAIVLAYNIPGVKNLVLTREQVVGIYNGSINNWNDPIFTQHNPNVDLPNATIVPVARFDYSGSTEIFTKSLSSFSDAWATWHLLASAVYMCTSLRDRTRRRGEGVTNWTVIWVPLGEGAFLGVLLHTERCYICGEPAWQRTHMAENPLGGQ